MKDSYEDFFNKFNIKFEDVIKFGVEASTIYPDKNKIKTRWNHLVKAVLDNKEVYIRGYGKNMSGSDLYR